MATFSAAMQAFNAIQPEFGANELLQRRDDELDEEKRRRKMAQQSGFSRAGIAAINYGLMSVPGAA